MVGFAKVHHPSNCLTLNNRNRFGDDGNVAAKDFSPICTWNGGNDDIIDSFKCDVNDKNNSWHKPKRRSRRCTINEPNNRHVNVQTYHDDNDNRQRKMVRVAGTIVNSCNLSMSFVFCAAILLLLLNIDAIKAEPQPPFDQQCEPKVLEETPPDPVSITIDGNLLFFVSINSTSWFFYLLCGGFDSFFSYFVLINFMVTL